MSRPLPFPLAAAAVAAVILAACSNDAPAPPPTVAPEGDLAFAYVDVAAEMGIRDRNRTGHDDAKNFIVEAMPPGVAVGDFDGDGWFDVYIPNGNNVLRYDKANKKATLLTGAEAPRNALYWNRGGRKFEEGAKAAGIDDPSWSFGVVAGDIDNDGDTDLYVCNWGANRLYLNNGDGTFEDAAVRAGVAGDPRDWSAGACLFDYDRDGDLDLYVAQYADVYDLLERPDITTIDAEGRVDGRNCEWKKLQVYCGPLGLKPLNDVLFKNLLRETGTLKFENVTKAAGLTYEVTERSYTEQSEGPFYGFQPVAWDIDGNGYPDVFVANDSVANTCFMNRGDGTFVDQAAAMSLALSMDDHNPQASMGIAVGDIDRDGLFDLAISEFSHDQFNLLVAERLPANPNLPVVFTEKASKTRLRQMTFLKLGWGTLFLDPDLDGDLDIFFACGHVYPEVDNFKAQQSSYRQTNLLVLNRDPKRPKLEDVSDRAGPGLQIRKPSRAAAVYDFDNDGDPDIVTTELNESPCLLRCDVDPARGGNWLAVRLVGDPDRGVPRDPAGAVVRIGTGDIVQSRVLLLGSSFQSSEDPRLLFGLGAAKKADFIEVLWPNGVTSRQEGVAAGRLVTITVPAR